MSASSTGPSALSIDGLRARIVGRVIGPEDGDYDSARRVFYAGADHRPAAIVRVAGTADVTTVVGLARESGLELAVRSGGHSGAGHGTTDGGIVLDLGDMMGLEVDVAGRAAWAETGLTAAELTAELSKHGLAVGFGDTGS
ncbi:MAG TPA: FAD-binding protein, partial [Candidatus Limnocylindrales bacterium]